ncbi:hypothetical protein [Haloferula sargassicola]
MKTPKKTLVPLLIALMTPVALPAADISEGTWVMAWAPMDEIMNVAKISRGAESDWKIEFEIPGTGLVKVPLIISEPEENQSKSASGGAQVLIENVAGKQEVRTIALHISFPQGGPAFGGESHRSQPLLRSDRELGAFVATAASGPALGLQMVEPPQPAAQLHLGGVCRGLGAVEDAATEDLGNPVTLELAGGSTSRERMSKR